MKKTSLKTRQESLRRMPNDNEDQEIVSGVAVKLPTFWSNDPTQRFLQAESQFNSARVTASRTKFDYVVTVLPHEIISEVIDIIITSKRAPEKILTDLYK